mmetsp:Transcript_54959/g.117958  ORF Transcript_54959/g.117958 Transcript_54959/m.117958 type:complete len:267 (+) Transcript_54959:1332-2132(+)
MGEDSLLVAAWARGPLLRSAPVDCAPLTVPFCDLQGVGTSKGGAFAGRRRLLLPQEPRWALCGRQDAAPPLQLPSKAWLAVGDMGAAYAAPASLHPFTLDGIMFSSLPRCAKGGRPPGAPPPGQRPGVVQPEYGGGAAGDCLLGGAALCELRTGGLWEPTEGAWLPGVRSRNGKRGTGESMRAKSATPRSGVSLLAELLPLATRGETAKALTVGGTGGGKRELANHEEARISSKLGRDLGSVRRMLATRSLDWSETRTVSGKLYSL